MLLLKKFGVWKIEKEIKPIFLKKIEFTEKFKKYKIEYWNLQIYKLFLILKLLNFLNL